MAASAVLTRTARRCHVADRGDRTTNDPHQL
jgi:hypothetical protein